MRRSEVLIIGDVLLREETWPILRSRDALALVRGSTYLAFLAFSWKSIRMSEMSIENNGTSRSDSIRLVELRINDHFRHYLHFDVVLYELA